MSALGAMSAFVLVAIGMAADRGLSGPTTSPAPATQPATDRIPRTTVELEFVQVPGGRLVLRGGEGRERAIEVKPFLIQRTEARWDEIDVMWHGLDLPEVELTRDLLKVRRETISGPSR